MALHRHKTLRHQVRHRVRGPLPGLIDTVPVLGDQNPFGADAREQGLQERAGGQRIGRLPLQRRQHPGPFVRRPPSLPADRPDYPVCARAALQRWFCHSPFLKAGLHLWAPRDRFPIALQAGKNGGDVHRTSCVKIGRHQGHGAQAVLALPPQIPHFVPQAYCLSGIRGSGWPRPPLTASGPVRPSVPDG